MICPLVRLLVCPFIASIMVCSIYSSARLSIKSPRPLRLKKLDLPNLVITFLNRFVRKFVR